MWKNICDNDLIIYKNGDHIFDIFDCPKLIHLLQELPNIPEIIPFLQSIEIKYVPFISNDDGDLNDLFIIKFSTFTALKYFLSICQINNYDELGKYAISQHYWRTNAWQYNIDINDAGHMFIIVKIPYEHLNIIINKLNYKLNKLSNKNNY